MEIKTFTLPIESTEMWENLEAFKDYVRRYVPNMSAIIQIARPWTVNQPKKQKYWVNHKEVFRRDRHVNEKMAEETMKQGKVIVAVTVID